MRLVLDRLLDHVGDLNDDQREKLIITVYDLAETANEGRRGLFDIEDIDSLAMRLGYHILKSIDKDKRKLLISKIFESAKSVYSPIHLISLLNQEREKYDKKQSPEEPLLSAAEIIEFKIKCVDKIFKSAEEGNLAANKNFIYLMFRWREWGSEEAPKKYIAKLIENEEGFFKLLRGSISEYLSQSMNDFVPRKIKQIDRKSIGEFIDIGEIDKRISKLDETKLDKEKADIIKLYRNPAKDRFSD